MNLNNTYRDDKIVIDPNDRNVRLLKGVRNIQRVEDVVCDELGPLPCYEFTELSAEE